MASLLQSIAAKAVTDYVPSLLYYKADAAARRDVRIVARGDAIDVIHERRRQIIRIGRANALYSVDMVNSFDYFFQSAEPVHVRRGADMFALVDFSTPRLHHVAGFDDFAVLCPSLTEPYQTTRQYLDFAALSEGQVAVDLGAYSALTSIAFSKEVGATGRVIAAEPDPLNFRAAEVNIASHARVNGLTNIDLVAAAVSDRPGMLRLSSEGAMGSALTSIVGGYRGAVVEVECLTLQGLADRSDAAQVNFVKMDIEGAEQATILGNLDFLRRHRPRLVIETHLLNGVMTTGPITEALTGIGYKVDMVEQEGLHLPLLTAAPAGA